MNNIHSDINLQNYGDVPDLVAIKEISSEYKNVLKRHIKTWIPFVGKAWLQLVMSGDAQYSVVQQSSHFREIGGVS